MAEGKDRETEMEAREETGSGSERFEIPLKYFV